MGRQKETKVTIRYERIKRNEIKKQRNQRNNGIISGSKETKETNNGTKETMGSKETMGRLKETKVTIRSELIKRKERNNGIKETMG